MKRQAKEDFIDSILIHVNTLQSLQAVATQVNRKLGEINIRRKAETNSKAKQLITQDFQCWKLLEHRIKISLPSYVDDAIAEQTYLLLPEYQRTGITRYRYLARFQYNAADIRRIVGFDKLVKFGWYNVISNPLGVVKDHRLSVKFGYDNKIDPSVLGHPANCEFLTVAENARKSCGCSINLLELHNKILKWEI